MARSKKEPDQESIIRSFQKVHGDKFDYSKVEFVDRTTKVTIICRLHGEFQQQPRLHMRGSNGCKKCIALRGK